MKVPASPRVPACPEAPTVMDCLASVKPLVRPCQSYLEMSPFLPDLRCPSFLFGSWSCLGRSPGPARSPAEPYGDAFSSTLRPRLTTCASSPLSRLRLPSQPSAPHNGLRA